MRFFQPAPNQPCYYCKKIAATEPQQDYPIRDGIYTYEKYIYRCAWHARFSCDICGKTHHFSWFYWCPSQKKLICGDCTSPTLKPVKFWDRTYAYQFFCEECQEYHYDLLYAEFQGLHPWQLNIRTIQSKISQTTPWIPIWLPKEIREGTFLKLAEALDQPNRAMDIRTDLKNTMNILVSRYAVPENEIRFSENQDSWTENSEQWIDFHQNIMQGDINRQLIIDPAIWNLLGDVQGKNVLDAGCGNGYLTRLLATKGAQAVGVDFSKTFIDFCKEKEEELHLGCDFYEGSITDMHQFDPQSFDLVVSNIVMVDVLDYKTTFKEIARVLKDHGRFVWSNVHPVFGRTAGAMDVKLPRDSPRNEARYLKMIDRYFDSGGELLDWMGKPTWQFMRTLEEYSKALKQAGFVISEIVEPKPTPELIQQHPRDLAFDADRWSHFIIFECIKRNK